MNPDQPSREEIEVKLTALLLGELPADEAKLLRWAIAQDAELKQLHDRLALTIGLMREVAAQPAVPETAKADGLKLSEERRRILQAHFQTPRPQPQPLFWLKQIKMPSLIPVFALVAVVAILAAMMLPALSSAKKKVMRVTALPGARSEELEYRNWGAGNADRESVINKSPASAGFPVAVPSPNVTVYSAPTIAPPPGSIYLPPTESSAEATPITGSLGNPGNSGVSSQNIVGYVNAPVPPSGIVVANSDLEDDGMKGELAGGEDDVPSTGSMAQEKLGYSKDTVVRFELDTDSLNRTDKSRTSAPVPSLGVTRDGFFRNKTDMKGEISRRLADTQPSVALVEKQRVLPIRNQPAPADAPSSLGGTLSDTLAANGPVHDEASQQNQGVESFSFGIGGASGGSGNSKNYSDRLGKKVNQLSDSTTRVGTSADNGILDPATGLPVASSETKTMDVSQALKRLADLSGIAIIQTNLSSTAKISLPKSSTKQEELQELLTGLAQNSISLVTVGKKSFKALQGDQDYQSNIAGRSLDTTTDLPVQKPALLAPIPQPEILTRDNAFSTFSLNVSDVSFKLAAASLEKGQMPDAAGIRSEEFINAFDYRDPEAAAGEPIAFATERARYPFAQNRDLLRFSVKTAAAGRPAGRALNLVLLLDNSGSMERADRVQIIREALRVLTTQLQPQDTVSVVSFARTARLWLDGVSGAEAGAALEKIGDLTPQGGTNLEEAMRLAYETARRHYRASGLNRVVLLTDGAANLGNVDAAVLKERVEANRQQGIALDCFGIGWEGLNDDLLEQLSRNGDGRYAFINTPEDAASEFAAKLAGALQIAASDVKVQVEFNPQRVVSYRQIGYAKHQLTKEQFRDNTVDAAEIAAQEAGNALYTVETKPGGVGPVATVRVRYKVPGTTDYRERSWDMPYTGNALALDQASSAMRLAATASAFSEWLAASPFAQEVTLDELTKLLHGVPEIYGADERPKQLGLMLMQAKSLAGK